MHMVMVMVVCSTLGIFVYLKFGQFSLQRSAKDRDNVRKRRENT